MKKIILFDYDDTLVDTIGSRIPAIKAYCRKYHNLNVTDEHIRKIWGVPFDRMMQELGVSRSVDKQEYLSVALNYPIMPFTETNAVLDTLKNSQQAMGILTSLSREVLISDLEVLNWNDGRFSYLFAQEDTPAHKPDPKVFEPFLSLIEREGHNMRNVVYVGNAMSDARAAIDAGIAFIGVARDTQVESEFKAGNIPYRTNLSDLYNLVRKRDLTP